MNDLFVKTNPSPGSQSLICEAEGLAEIQKTFSTHGLKTPKVISLARDEMRLEKIKARPGRELDFQKLGRGLARLHREKQRHFGWSRDNFIGLNPQKNSWNANWGEFFVNTRLGFQISMISPETERERLVAELTSVRIHLVDFLNAHSPQPALVHGDLWSGNVLFADSGVYLIDPAVYCGDREVDVAMTQMFGGFSSAFYSSYREEQPLAEGFERRAAIYNLYHYLNHYNLFGSTYWSAVEEGFANLRTLY